MKILSKRARVDINLAERSALDYIDIKKLADTLRQQVGAFAGGYDPTCITEDFVFPCIGSGKGSMVEVLPEGYFTKDEMAELTRCKSDPTYFITTYCLVPHPTLGTIEFDTALRPYLKGLLSQLTEGLNLVIKHPRQAGITFANIAYALWRAVFLPHQSILLGAVNHAQAMELRAKLDFMYKHLPSYMKPRTRYSNRQVLELDNGSAIRYQAITESFGRGISFSFAYLDSFALVKPEIQEYVYDCLVPTIYAGGQAVIASTPDQTNTCFHSLWCNAFEKVGPFTPFSVSFAELPQAGVISVSNLKNIIGEVAFKREYLAEFVTPAPVKIDLLDRITGIVPSERPNGFLWELPDPDERDLGITEARYR